MASHAEALRERLAGVHPVPGVAEEGIPPIGDELSMVCSTIPSVCLCIVVCHEQ